MKAMRDPIIAELRKIPDEHAARFNYDMDGIVADLQAKEKDARHKLVNRKPRMVVKK